MNLLINNVPAQIKMIPFESKKGFILQILVKGQKGKTAEVHSQIVEALTMVGRGVMDEQKLKRGKSEIRVLEHTTLEIIDLLRMNGFGITEQPLNQ